MRYPWFPQLNRLLRDEPTVGNLMELCEESYSHLLRIIPDLRTMSGSYRSVRENDTDLHLEILEQSPYTTLVRLTYYFEQADGGRPEPNAILRAYHDARQVDVVDLRQHALPSERSFQAPSLTNRWRVSLFANRWLAFCMIQGHLFESTPEIEASKRSCLRV